MPQDVFNDYNRTIHHHSKIERAERQEICRNVASNQGRWKQTAARTESSATTMNADRRLPRKRNRTIETSRIPSVRLCMTVCVVKCTRSLRSRNGTIFTPGGRKCVLR